MMGLLRQPVRQITCYGVGIQIQAESCLYPLWQDALVLLAGAVLQSALCWGVVVLRCARGSGCRAAGNRTVGIYCHFSSWMEEHFLRLWLPEQGRMVFAWSLCSDVGSVVGGGGGS